MSRRLDQMTATSLGRARERLARVAWLFGGGLVMLSVFEGLLFIALFGTERWELSLYTQDADIVTAAVWLGLVGATRSGWPDLAVLRAGQVAVVLSTFTMAVVTGVNAAAAGIAPPVLTWSAVWIALYPLLVPTPPRATLATVGLAAAVAPVGLTLGGVLWGDWIGWPAVLGSVVAPSVAAVLALWGSDVVHASTVDLEDLVEQEALLGAVIEGVDETIELRDPDGVAVFSSHAGVPREVLDSDGLVVHPSQRAETWLVTHREVFLGGRPHRLTVARRLTPALDEAEVQGHKDLIRALSHELSNSLAPMSSLLHSVELMLDAPRHAEALRGAVASLQGRVAHLSAFLEDYAGFARLPRPRCSEVSWVDVVRALEPLAPFRVVGPLQGSGWFDRGQLEQVLLNLLKNAAEAGSAPDEIELSVRRSEGGWLLTVADRGEGLSDEVVQRATLPFFSTKARGTGLGLALCRDIALAHGGWFGLVRRANGGAEARVWLPVATR